MATMRPTPRNEFFGLLSDYMAGGLAYMRDPQRTQQMQGLAGLLESTGIPKTTERLAYGEPLTNIGRANVPLLKPETAEALLTVAPFAPKGMKMIRATEGMPVGMSIKPINLNKGIYKPELTMEEMLKVKDIPTVDRVRQSIDLVGEKEFEKMVNAQYKKYKPSDVDQEAMLVESVTLNILGKAQRSPYPQQAALDLAQQRAALPVEQGGLGLPANNTAMDRARAMGYPMGKGFDVSYETGHSPIAITNTLSKPTSPRKKAEIIKAELEQMGIPVVGETAGTGSTYLKIPGNPYDISPKYGGGQTVPIETLRFSTHSKKEFGKPTNRPDLDSYLADVFPKGGNSLEEARKAINDLIKQGGIRSRFAAFDPFRKDVATATAMGVALPDLLAAELPEEELKRNQSAGLLFP